MKALVLCGGIPQIALIQELKKRRIITVLADMNNKVAARKFADFFYPVSTLDVKGIKKIAIDEQVDFLITVCADQVLLVVAQVSEELKLPCYIDYETAINVSNKAKMKQKFIEFHIPTSKYVISDVWSMSLIKDMKFPLIVKPVDSYSSKGVRKVFNSNELKLAFKNAANISRTNTAIIEEFVLGAEITVDAYVENGSVRILCVSNLDKINDNDKFIIQRTRYPANISKKIIQQVENAAQDIALAFNLKNTPMLIQIIVSEDGISVVEFCARTGGGDKFRLIKKVTGFDVISTVIDLTLGCKPNVKIDTDNNVYILNEFLYCKPGIFDSLKGFEELEKEGIISEYYQLKQLGDEIGVISSSGDRVAYFTIETNDLSELYRRHQIINNQIQILDVNGNDILRHDLITTYEK